MAADGSQDTPLLTRLTELASVVAPTTLATALLIYFGAVYTDGRLSYYGIQLGLADLSTQDLIIFGIEGLYSPLAFALAAAIACLCLGVLASWFTSQPRPQLTTVAISSTFVLVGGFLIARAVIGVISLEVYRSEFAGTTPTALAVGVLLIWFGFRTARRALPDPIPQWFLLWSRTPIVQKLLKALRISIIALVLISLFWTTNRFAFTLGLNRSHQEAVDVRSLYIVTIDTEERLLNLPRGIKEKLVPGDEKGDKATYRYERVRLVLESGGNLFLAPRDWTPESRTFILPYKSQDVRLQLLPPPANLAP